MYEVPVKTLKLASAKYLTPDHGVISAITDTGNVELFDKKQDPVLFALVEQYVKKIEPFERKAPEQPPAAALPPPPVVVETPAPGPATDPAPVPESPSVNVEAPPADPGIVPPAAEPAPVAPPPEMPAEVPQPPDPRFTQ